MAFTAIKQQAPLVAPAPAQGAEGDIGGFSLNYRQNFRRRLVVSLAGLDKTGKTHFALGAPGPQAYANYDTGLEGVVEKFNKLGLKVYRNDYRLNLPPGTLDPVKIAEIAHELWERFKRDVRAAIASPIIRTITVDTESETWELIRLARFGKLTQVMPHHYGPVNSEYRNFYNEIYDCDKNMILLGRMKDEWENDAAGKGRKTGRLERVGMKEIPFMVQINLRAHYNPFGGTDDRFSLEVVNCRQNEALSGSVFPQMLCTFPQIAQMVYPDTQPSDWS